MEYGLQKLPTNFQLPTRWLEWTWTMLPRSTIPQIVDLRCFTIDLVNEREPIYAKGSAIRGTTFLLCTQGQWPRQYAIGRNTLPRYAELPRLVDTFNSAR